MCFLADTWLEDKINRKKQVFCVFVVLCIFVCVLYMYLGICLSVVYASWKTKTLNKHLFYNGFVCMFVFNGWGDGAAAAAAAAALGATQIAIL